MVTLNSVDATSHDITSTCNHAHLGTRSIGDRSEGPEKISVTIMPMYGTHSENEADSSS